MEFNKDKVDEMTLALMFLGSFTDKNNMRAWKGFDWEALDRLHKKGFISNPKSKARSVLLTDDGINKAEALFKEFFEIQEKSE